MRGSIPAGHLKPFYTRSANPKHQPQIDLTGDTSSSEDDELPQGDNEYSPDIEFDEEV